MIGKNLIYPFNLAWLSTITRFLTGFSRFHSPLNLHVPAIWLFLLVLTYISLDSRTKQFRYFILPWKLWEKVLVNQIPEIVYQGQANLIIYMLIFLLHGNIPKFILLFPGMTGPGQILEIGSSALFNSIISSFFSLALKIFSFLVLAFSFYFLKPFTWRVDITFSQRILTLQ